MLAKVQPGNDAFLTEKYHELIAAVFSRWARELLASPKTTGALETAMSHDFRGATFSPAKHSELRSASSLQISRLQFSSEATLGADGFLAALNKEFAAFNSLRVAEFQVTGIRVTSGKDHTNPVELHTDVRFELVGTCADQTHEQRVGYWSIDWSLPNESEARIRGWRVTQEERARFSGASSFSDIGPQAFASAASFQEQLSPGIDHWRTVLDGASGIDIYGHNGVSFADIDGDGFDDLYICQPAGLPNRLFRNRGDGTFEDITESSGLRSPRQHRLRTVRRLLQLRPPGRDHRAHRRPAAVPQRWARQIPTKSPTRFNFANAAARHVHRRGGRRLRSTTAGSTFTFACTSTIRAPINTAIRRPTTTRTTARRISCCCNNRDGSFRDVTKETDSIATIRDSVFAAAGRLMTAMAWPDLYVVNDFGRKNLYRNNGNGTFTRRRAAKPASKTSARE